ncbi:MAG TPA: alpha/beta hydrolase [Nocardioidaceae bacterium]|nr:alpha/beta hydrolase [Nocardioidaceae bacterium]
MRSILRYSPSAHASRAMMRILRHKRSLDSAERVQRDVERRSVRPQSYAPPRRLRRKVDIEVGFRRDWRCYELTPHGEEPAVRVLYLHGGAYIEEIGSMQWTAVAKLAVEAPARITVPIYPLAPHSTAATTVPTATRIAAELLDEHGSDVMLMGDSAGGALALAVAQQLRDEYDRQPRRIVLISPWLDATLSNPAIHDVHAQDAVLAAPGLAEAGRIYAGHLDPADPLVSPLHGDFTGLAPTTVLCGTHDILIADCREFVARARASGVHVDYEELPRGHHNYPLYPTRHGRSARHHIARTLTADWRGSGG